MLPNAFKYFLILLLSLVAGHAAPNPTLTLIERLGAIPYGWRQGPEPKPSTLLQFRLAVRQQNADVFEQTVIDISTPDHPLYGQHLKRNDLKELLRPSTEVSEEILSWLVAEGIRRERIQDSGDWISFAATVREAERLLNTRFYYFTHLGSNLTKIRTLEYSLPESIAAHVHMIQPTTYFGRAVAPGGSIHDISKRSFGHRKMRHTNNCSTQNTPRHLRELYGLNDLGAAPRIQTRIGISGYLEQYAQRADLSTFLAKYNPETVGANFSVVSINGGLNTQNSSDNSIEANLDMQYVVSLSQNAKVTYYSTGGRGPLVPDLDQPNATQNLNEPYLEQLLYLLGLADDQLPHVLTTSYGEDEQSVPATYARSVCSLFAQLGARGVSVIFSSGDNGVGTACQTNDGKNTTRFNPTFPGACPFVTSVGATFCANPERAVNFSQGGFSDIFPRPPYQDTAVRDFLKILGNTWSGLYNPNGRGFPDVAAQGVSFRVIDKGRDVPVDGTSASTPTFAAVIANLNSLRLSQGKPVLGFLNPWIYSKGYRGFTDISQGGSVGCTGTDFISGLPAPLVPFASWNATVGWDPVTGFGTPNFHKLRELMP